MITKEQYEEKCREFVSARMYDGRGEFHIYECSNCHSSMITAFKDKGVTPFTIKCRACGKVSYHEKTVPEVPVEMHSFLGVKYWVRPTYEQFVKLPLNSKEHVLNGGLLFEEELPNV